MKKYVFCLMLCSLISIAGYSQRVYVIDSEESIWYIETEVSIDEPLAAEASSGNKVAGCQYKGVPLYGKVKFVNSFPDFKVKIVENFPDLKVKYVENFPDACGKWKVVENFPDFKVQIVENFPDFTIKIVENFPGMP